MSENLTSENLVSEKFDICKYLRLFQNDLCQIQQLSLAEHVHSNINMLITQIYRYLLHELSKIRQIL
jgi:hypothetical protein